MKLSVSMWCIQKEFFSGKKDVKDFINLAKKWDVDAVELLEDFWKNPDEVDMAKKMLKDYNLPISSYSIGNDFVVENPSELDEQIKLVKNGVDTAVRLDAKLMRVFSGSPKTGITFEEGRKNIIKGFKETIKYAEDHGITMVLENHGVFAGKASQVKGIIDEIGSPNLKANCDTGNFLLVLEDPVKAISDLKGYVGFIHFKDFRKLSEPNGLDAYTAIDSSLYQGTPIGQGQVDLKTIVKNLKDSGYDGYLSIEYEGVGDPISETEQSIDYLKKLMKNI